MGRRERGPYLEVVTVGREPAQYEGERNKGRTPRRKQTGSSQVPCMGFFIISLKLSKTAVLLM